MQVGDSSVNANLKSLRRQNLKSRRLAELQIANSYFRQRCLYLELETEGSNTVDAFNTKLKYTGDELAAIELARRQIMQQIDELDKANSILEQEGNSLREYKVRFQ